MGSESRGYNDATVHDVHTNKVQNTATRNTRCKESTGELISGDRCGGWKW